MGFFRDLQSPDPITMIGDGYFSFWTKSKNPEIPAIGISKIPGFKFFKVVKLLSAKFLGFMQNPEIWDIPGIFGIPREKALSDNKTQNL